MAQHTWKLAALAAAAWLSACGGGGGADAASNRAGITSVVTMGDSLASIGTRAADGTRTVSTVNASADEPTVIWTERINANLGITTPLCSHYPANAADCTSYAVSSARINVPGQSSTSSLSILKQMTDAATTLGRYTSAQLVLIDGGGNDAADLFGAYLKAATDGGASFAGLISSLAGAGGDPAPALTQLAAKNLPGAGAAYMSGLADVFTAKIINNVVGKGATRVAVLNMPAVTRTPRFQMVLTSVAARTAAGAKQQGASDAQAAAAGAKASADLTLLADTWVSTFNARIAANLASQSGVAVVDFDTRFRDQVLNPAQYGLTNATTPVCPVTGVEADTGLPSYNFTTCTAAALDAQPGKTAGWWTHYAFSDGFHPTPYGHQLISQLVSVSLAQKGWQ